MFKKLPSIFQVWQRFPVITSLAIFGDAVIFSLVVSYAFPGFAQAFPYFVAASVVPLTLLVLVWHLLGVIDPPASSRKNQIKRFKRA